MHVKRTHRGMEHVVVTRHHYRDQVKGDKMGGTERVRVVATLFTSYLGDARFESRPAHPVSRLMLLVNLFRSTAAS